MEKTDNGWTIGPKGGRLIGQHKAVRCPLCKALAVVPLTTSERAKQPDDTTHVCHPGFGGCNHGFAAES